MNDQLLEVLIQLVVSTGPIGGLLIQMARQVKANTEAVGKLTAADEKMSTEVHKLRRRLVKVESVVVDDPTERLPA